MTRLDENRAKTQLAKKAGVPVARGHQRGDLGQPLGHAVPRLRATPASAARPAPEVITDTAWLQGEFIETVQKRGAAVIEKRGRVVGGVGRERGDRLGEQRALRRRRATTGTRSRSCSHGEYGVPEGLQFGFPVRSDGSSWTVVEGIEHDDFAQGKIARHHRGARRRARRGPRARPHR